MHCLASHCRRSTIYRGSAVLAAIWLIACVGLGGCGGSGSHRAPTVAVQGHIGLPPGSALGMASLRVVGCIASQSPDAAGQFTLEQPGSSPALVSVLDASGDLVLCGYLSGDGSGRAENELDAHSTATALLYQATGAWGLPEESMSAALELIGTAPETTAAAGVIETRLAANPKAIANGDGQIKAALALARDALVPPAFTGSPASPAIGRTGTAGSKTRAGEPQATQVAVTSENPLYALQLGPMDEQDGLQVLHTRRRHCYYYIYEKGYTDEQGAEHTFAPDSWPEAGRGYISATNGLAGVIGSLVDVAADNVAYKPVEVGPIPVPMHSGAKQTHYRMMVVGCGLTDTVPPPEIKGNARFGIWDDGRLAMSALSLLKDVLLPTVFACISPDAVKNLTAVEISEAALDIIGAATQSGLDASVALSQGDLHAAGLSILKGLASDELFRTRVAEIVAKRLLRAYAPATVSALLAEFGNSLNVWLKLFDVGMTGWDLGMVLNDVAKSCPFVPFDIEVTLPTVRVSPELIGVRPGNTATFAVTKGAVAGAVFQYHAMTSGKIGSLEGGPNFDIKGTDIWTSTPEFRYYVGPEEADGQEDSVTVEVFRQLTAGGARQFVGRSAAKVVVASSTVTLSPAVSDVQSRIFVSLTATIDPPVPAPYTVLFHWFNPGTAGHLDGGQDEYDSTSATALYRAGDKAGKDTVSVTAYRVLGDQKVGLGSSRALINVAGGTWVSVQHLQVGPTAVVVGSGSSARTWVVFGLAYVFDPPAGCTGWYQNNDQTYQLRRQIPWQKDYSLKDPINYGIADQLGYKSHTCYTAAGDAREVTWLGLEYEIDICAKAIEAYRKSWDAAYGSAVFCN